MTYGQAIAKVSDAEHTAPAGHVVWVLSSGEMHEGGTIQGIYTDRVLARGEFTKRAQALQDRFSIDDARQDEDGSIHLSGGCDWIALEPHPLITAVQLDA
ncbi:hypothetical protein [Streptomyces caniscabiei]|uniref:hypothetical protein n=1 Tax=Streptomyces caniscabiei TaxID=2746961 RepID=UPI0029ABF281|nr:hypothetical protein [Streptomyces caniscabiei]MDX2986532.1 hypothetical protein [Streptomyces caniscabiei]